MWEKFFGSGFAKESSGRLILAVVSWLSMVVDLRKVVLGKGTGRDKRQCWMQKLLPWIDSS